VEVNIIEQVVPVQPREDTAPVDREFGEGMVEEKDESALRVEDILAQSEPSERLTELEGLLAGASADEIGTLREALLRKTGGTGASVTDPDEELAEGTSAGEPPAAT
jgi:hypothetical protein